MGLNGTDGDPGPMGQKGDDVRNNLLSEVEEQYKS